MSLKTMQLMQEHYRSQDERQDHWERSMRNKRAAVTPPADLEIKAKSLVKTVMAAVGSGKANSFCGELIVELRGWVPDDVAERAVAAFKANGWQARYAHNDGFNNYNSFNLKLPKDWVERLMPNFVA